MKRVLKNTLFILCSKFIDPFISLILVIAIARHLGARGFGEYSFIKSCFTIFLVFSGLGLDQLITRDVAQNLTKASSYLLNLGILSTGFSICMAVVMSLWVYLSKYPAEVIIASVIMSSALVAATFANVSRAIIAAFERFELNMLLISGENLIRVLLGTLSLALGYGLITLILLITGVRFMGAMVSLWIIHRKITPIKWKIEFDCIIRLFKNIPTFSLISIFSVLYWRIDVVMLSRFCNMLEVGIYTAAFRLMELVKALPLSLKQALFPLNAQEFGREQKPLLNYLSSVLRYLMVVLSVIAIAITFGANKLVNLLYGNEFSGAVPVLRILIWTIVPYSVAMMLANILVASGNQRIDLWCNIFGFVINVLLNLTLIPRYQAIGASFATLISIIFFTGFQILVINCPWFRFMTKMTICPVNINLSLFRKYFNRSF